MHALSQFLALFVAVLWLIVLLLPWRPWSNRGTLEPSSGLDVDLSVLTVVIPARNEADVIGRTLRALARQGHDLRVVLVNDGS